LRSRQAKRTVKKSPPHIKPGNSIPELTRGEHQPINPNGGNSVPNRAMMIRKLGDVFPHTTVHNSARRNEELNQTANAINIGY
jgi:hypothetical protein